MYVINPNIYYMKKQLLSSLFVAFALLVASCKKEDALQSSQLQKLDANSKTGVTASLITGKYADGFFIANEGWFGHGTGDLHFIRIVVIAWYQTFITWKILLAH